jgi:hypothetical protein
MSEASKCVEEGFFWRVQQYKWGVYCCHRVHTRSGRLGCCLSTSDRRASFWDLQTCLTAELPALARSSTSSKPPLPGCSHL